MVPNLVVHADWGSNPKKCWLARAYLQQNGDYLAQAPELVGEAETLLQRLHSQAGAEGCVLLGFDFPIGLPHNYAAQAGIDNFLTVLPQLGQGKWRHFYQVAERPDEISLTRPFYPKRPGGTRQRHLLDGLNVESIHDLRRLCELPQPHRRAAAPLFWTLGGQQVGKAAINGWQTAIVPGLRTNQFSVSIWPFSGALFELFRPGELVIAETYPGECYHHLGVTFSPSRPGRKSGKRIQQDRRANASVLDRWAMKHKVQLTSELQAVINDGFGPKPAGEDPFDAVVGLFGMLGVVLNYRTEGTPDDDRIRQVEGWILGQQQVETSDR